jgi:DNA invertase Pin-like site-specific DNA recombinase
MKKTTTLYKSTKVYIVKIDGNIVTDFAGKNGGNLKGFEYAEDSAEDAQALYRTLIDEKLAKGFSKSKPEAKEAKPAKKAKVTPIDEKTGVRGVERESLRERVEKLAAKGLTQKAIAEQVELPLATVWRWIRNYTYRPAVA